MQAKLTAAMVVQFAPAKGKVRDYVWDTAQPGFGLMATAKGARSYVIQYRVAGTGRSRRMRIGAPKTMTIDKARQVARVKLGQVALGQDPLKDHVEQREAHRAGRHDTVDAVVKRYLAKHTSLAWYGKLKRTLEHDVIPKWKMKVVSDLTPDDVSRLVEEIAERAPVQANRVLVVIKMLCTWCVESRILKASPAAGVKKPTDEKERDRVLSDDELRAVWKAADAEGVLFGTCIKLLVLMLQRRDEVAGMAWPEISADGKTWVIPGERAKNGDVHEVHLSPQAIALLAEVPKVEKVDLVFSTTGKTPISGFSKLKTRLDKVSKVSDWIIHDLRRTGATGMASIGIPPHVVDKILNHRTGTIKGVARIYNRFEYGPERRTALEAWANFVDRIISNDPAARTNVVPIRGAAQI